MFSTTKRLLIQEFIDSPDDVLKSNSLDDLHVETLQEFLQNPENDLEIFQSLMKKFYELYQKNDPKLRLLLLSFIPSLCSIYIRVYHNYYQSARAEFNCLSILILCLYNCEIIDKDTGRPKTIDIRHVSLTKPSIYHEPNIHTQNMVGQNLPTEIALKNIVNDPKIRLFGPYDEAEHLNSSNYFAILTVLMKIYIQNISNVGSHSLGSLCRYSLRLLRQGTKIDIREKIHQLLMDDTQPKLPRNCVQIQFSSAFLVELTRAIYFCIYNDFYELGIEVLQEICTRATLNLNSDILLMVNAIKNSLAIKHSREQSTEIESAVGNQERSLQRNTRPHIKRQNNHDLYSIVRKAAITTASFKTRKLPDDIPIVERDPAQNGDSIQNNHTMNNNNNNHSYNYSASNKHGGFGNKNLDSIHEEVLSNGELSSKQLKKKESQDSTNRSLSSSGAKTKVLNMIKESKAKLSKVGGKENGKMFHSSKNNGPDSDASLNESIAKLSLNDSFSNDNEPGSIPLSLFHRKRSKSIGRCVDTDDGQDDLHVRPNVLHSHSQTHRKDSSDGNSSDKSVSSSKSLLAKTRSFDSDKIAHLSSNDIS